MAKTVGGVEVEMDQILDRGHSSVLFSNASSNFSLVELSALCEVIKPLLTLPWFCKVILLLDYFFFSSCTINT